MHELIPLLTVETEVNGHSMSTNERGPSLVGSLGYPASTSDFCLALAALVGKVPNIFFLTVQYFNSFVPIAQQASQAVVLSRRLLGCVFVFGV